MFIMNYSLVYDFKRSYIRVQTRIAIQLNVTIKLQKAMILLNKHESCRCAKAPPAGRKWMCIFNKAVVVSRVFLQYQRLQFLRPYSFFLLIVFFRIHAGLILS